MTNRTLCLLLALGCCAACGGLIAFVFSGTVQGDRGNARLLSAFIFLFGAGALYFLVAAFSSRRHRFAGHNYDEYTTFSCPTCGVELNYSQFPAFKDEFPCPKCGQTLTRKPSGDFQIRFVRSPEVAYELSAGKGPPPPGPVTENAVQAAFAAGKDFTVAADPGGWLVLTATVGPPRWVDGATPGSVVGEAHQARLTLLPTADVAALRPEVMALVSTETNLTVNACVALSSALGPLRVRMQGADEWIDVDPSGRSVFAQLSLQLFPLSKAGNPT